VAAVAEDARPRLIFAVGYERNVIRSRWFSFSTEILDEHTGLALRTHEGVAEMEVTKGHYPGRIKIVFKRKFLLAVVIALAVPVLSSAQVSQSDELSTFRDRKLVIPSTEELIKSGARKAVDTAAEVIGLVRTGQRITTAYNTLSYTATGTMAEPGADGTWHNYKVTKLVADLDFVIPASRFIMDLSPPDGHAIHEIRVVAGKQAWNEEKPGINGKPMPATVVDDRLRLIWLTPQGAMWGAIRAAEAKADNVTLGNVGGRLTMTYPWNGDMIKITFDAELRPQRVEIKGHSNAYGDTTLEASYLGYKDFEGYLAPFPTKMTYKAGTRVILDVNVTSNQANPYVIFPTPENMAKSTAAGR
jgi:hypothetical protein